MNVPPSITTLLIGILLTLASLWFGQHNNLLPTAASVEAANIDRLFNVMVAIATGLFLLVQGALLYSLFAFRKRKGDESDAKPVHGNVPLELVWTAIPSVIVLWLAIYSFDVYKSVNSFSNLGNTSMAHTHHAAVVADASTDSALEGEAPAAVTLVADAPSENLVIDVTGLQYAWLFNYADSDIVSGELHVPIHQPVALNISAKDVIHSFWVPEFRLKQDAIPGQETHLRFVPNRLGSYPIICAELCGAYHGAMKTKVIVQTPEDYQAWFQSRQVALQADQQEAAQRLSQPGEVMEAHLASMGLQPEALTQAATQAHQSHLTIPEPSELSEHVNSHAALATAPTILHHAPCHTCSGIRQ